jgi:60S ribosomal subunit assembly/export protein LOC1
MMVVMQESMMTILAMVNAEKEGQIESKMIKARQMEEIREAKRKEADARQEHKKAKLVSLQHQPMSSRLGGLTVA